MSCVISSQKDRKEEPVYPKMDRTEQVQSWSGFIIGLSNFQEICSHTNWPQFWVIDQHLWSTPIPQRPGPAWSATITSLRTRLWWTQVAPVARGSHVWGFLGHGPRNHFNCTISVGDWHGQYANWLVKDNWSIKDHKSVCLISLEKMCNVGGQDNSTI